MTGHVQPEDVQAYLTGEMRQDRLHAFEAHIDGCEACADMLTCEAQIEGALYELAAEITASDAAERQEGPWAAGWSRARRWLCAPRGLGLASAVALAAGVALMMLTPSRHSELPPYELSWQSGRVEVRAAGADLEPLVAQDGFSLVLQPQHDSTLAPEVRVYVGERLVTGGLQVQRAPSGAMNIQVEPGAAVPEAGDSALYVVVGPPEAAWSAQPLAGGLSEANRVAGWQVLQAPLSGGGP